MAIFDDFRAKPFEFRIDWKPRAREHAGRVFAAMAASWRAKRERDALNGLPDHLLRDAGFEDKSAGNGEFIPLGNPDKRLYGKGFGGVRISSPSPYRASSSTSTVPS